MANLGETFVPEQVEDSDFSPIPEGQYGVIVNDADIKATKSGTGKMVKVTLEVLSPSHVGRLIFANFNYINQSEVAQRIGRAQLKELCLAVGIAELKDTDQLIGKKCLAEVKIRPAKDGYDAQNEVKKFSTARGKPAPAPAPAPKKETKLPEPPELVSEDEEGGEDYGDEIPFNRLDAYQVC